MPNAQSESSRGIELRVFLLLTVVLAPVLSVLIVSGFGFAIWISQMILGPPGI
ncbi:MAG: periplasmic nitrate reductase, NapE protein [Gammaproteobacteria bacterium HGW-Gammaproteobacteria-8]|jgi:nitrate reductase NapE|nr:MAG: periplasmic nitrate reductase, NapE protein [Gammaproteobacteria bacterium HGW-Gammaproteobacteria-8]PKM16233.1 MAG: periplasmic nitrate reductase, NapE protein [Gammaproteobacteria bacterium HGW-Gammaproteobacteria-2]